MALQFVLVVVISLAASVSGQTCQAAGETGPCIPGMGCPGGSQCVTGNTVCCLTASIIQATCEDKTNPNTGTSDCPRRTQYCNNPIYKNLMAQQCPKTCGLCTGGSTGTTISSSSCVDRLNPLTGVSDCTRYSNLCNNAAYFTLMTQQCPRTCGRCTSG